MDSQPMEQQHHRKCSLAIESPIQEGFNNPLNAFLLYNNDSGPTTNDIKSDPNFEPEGLPTYNHEELPKSASLPDIPLGNLEIKDEDNDNNYQLNNRRRISICDLCNFNEEIKLVKYNPTHQSFKSNHESRMRPSNTEPAMAKRDLFNLDQYQFKNHHRRNSIALKFEEPKCI